MMDVEKVLKQIAEQNKDSSVFQATEKFKDALQPGAISSKMALPFYRIEMKSPSNTWEGLFRTVGKNPSLQNAIFELKSFLRSRPMPGGEFYTKPIASTQDARFLYTKRGLPKHLREEAKQLAEKFPDDLRFLELPDEIKKTADYKDWAQIVTDIRTLSKYLGD